ncbi:type VI secretion system Vgr family protein [Pseudomonas sp. D1-2]|uniref:type VI secretion system Vgr family protein n=1 Tax=unclassified Pseudomonas TaxID=196821 RepID=UPI003DA8D306
MSDPACELPFRLEIAGLSEPFVVVALTGNEAISEPFVFEVELSVSDMALDMAGLLYRNVWLSFGTKDQGIHGRLHEIVHRHGESCRVRIGPKLASLAQRFSQRVFNACSVPQIIRQVLGGHGINGRSLCLDLSNAYPSLDLYTQYRESDLHFLQRMCAQAGIHFHFDHTRDGKCLVFADTAGNVPTMDKALYSVEGRARAVRAFTVKADIHGALVAQGRSDLTHLHAGQILSLKGHPHGKWNQGWLLTQVEHHGHAGGYGNLFQAIPWGMPFLVDRAPDKPVMVSRQRGWVVEVDEPRVAGRVAVQFDWAYQGEGAIPSHCWLPLAPELAARGVGTIAEGTEVLVSFIEGDPDRPLVSAFLGGAPGAQSTQALPPTAPAGEIPGASGVDSSMLSAIKDGEPLVLLCLLPGGGRFSPCAQPVCTCRMVMGQGAGAAP